MGIAFLIFLLTIIVYLIYTENIGSLLCLCIFFPEIIGLLLHSVGLMGFNMITKYALFLTILWLGRGILDVKYTNVWKHPLSILLYILIGTLVIHNVFIIGGANNNPDIAAFQLNAIIRILIPYIVLMLVADQEDILRDIGKSIPFWGLFYSIIFIFLIGISSVDFSDRSTLQEETGIGSIALSRAAAITTIGALICFLNSQRTINKYFYIGIFLIGTFLLLLASQRGTIIGVAAALLALSPIFMHQGKLKQWLYGILGFSVIAIISISFFDFQIQDRFQELEQYRTFERFADYGLAWRAFSENGFLTGLGSMGYKAYTGGFRPYPHSIVLELMAEYGIIGLVYAMSLVIGGGLICYRIITNTDSVTTEMAIPLVWICLLFSALVSGCLIDNATCLLTTGFLISLLQNREENEDLEENEDCEETAE